ncbi:MAG: hypothetical protein LQ343_007109 [Gyalolechia ehrenbergii]|nr:MAG: hypothetical protein LQ343_007109 [Gyalolechia ehrenbergii]
MTDSSRTDFTPSETLPSPAGSMIDSSQLGTCTDHEGLVISTDLAPSGSDWPMDVDFDLLPGILPIFERDGIGATQVEQALNKSVVIGYGQASASGQHPILDHYDTMTLHAVTPTNDEVPNIQSCYPNQNQRILDRLAVIDRAYHHTAVTNPFLADDGPRYIPGAIDGTAAPWSPWVASQPLGNVPPVPELLYEPAVEVVVGDRNSQGYGYPEGLAEEFDLEMHMEEDVCLDGPAFPEVNVGPPPPPDPLGPPIDMANRSKDHPSEDYKTRLVGGRRHGPLDAQSRQNAQTTRQRGGQCWSCILQRGQQAILAEQHDPQKLRAFASNRVNRWLDNHMTIYLTWGYFRNIKCDVTEVESNGPSLLLQNQYRLNLETNQYDLVQVPSPPLGMVLMLVKVWRTKLDSYLEELLETSFGRFPEVCFRGDACRVERDLLLPIFEYHQAASGKVRKLVHQSLKLVVVTHIMTHSMTLVESTKDYVYDRLRNPPRERYGQQTSPRWVNKQFKFLLCALHQDLLRDVLSQIQETLRLSGKRATWAALFAGMTILAMTTESMQMAVRGKDETDKGEGTVRQNDTTADEAIKLMDERFDLLENIFHQAHRTPSSRGLNPVQKIQDRAILDGASQSLAAKASEIIENHHKFLIARRGLTPPTKASEPQTGRLVARFLLCFSPPVEQHHHQPADPASS